ncbi:hypothetical protein [Alcaligenes aquatilis]|uniref:hypothetical protein n=1 Tax=Alcaligenes aquatilis TaxID=323284 RepID=UPI003F91EC92
MDYPKSLPGIGLVGGKFADANPTTGAPGSWISAVWANSVMDELLAIIADGGFTPSEADNSQVLKAMKALMDARVPAAAESKAGIARIATTTQAQAMADNATILTPKKLAEAFQGVNQGKLGTSMHQRLPGGWKLQCGSAITPANGSLSISFIDSFVEPPIVALASLDGSTTSTVSLSGAPQLTQFYVRSGVMATGGATPLNFYWIALGK